MKIGRTLSRKKDKDKDLHEKRLAEERKRLNAEDEIEAAISRSSIKTRKNKARRRRIWQGLGVLVLLLLVWFGYYLFTPYKGSMAYGACKVFLEQSVQYPTELHISQVEEFSNWVRIWYTKVDGFGAYRMEPIQCFFRLDESLGLYVLEKITIDRREVNPETVTRFNKSLPLLSANPPDLALPTPLPDTLRNLRFEVNKFVKPII